MTRDIAILLARILLLPLAIVLCAVAHLGEIADDLYWEIDRILQ